MNMTIRKMTDRNFMAYYIHNVLTIAFIAIVCFIALYSFVYVPDYESYQISDWMINYEGGFVRRGLMGQLLLYANSVHNFDVRYAILIIELIFYILFFYLLSKIFIKYKWSLLGAMFPIVCSTTSIAVYRRDFMMLCLCYFSYNYFFKYLRNNGGKTLLISLTIMSIGIIIYEPVFFVLVPVLIMQYWSKKRNILSVLSLFSIPLLCMILSCIFRGTVEQVDEIWQSWVPYISQYVDIENENIGLAIQFLGMTNKEVFAMHYDITFADNPLLATITLIIVFILAFFLCTHIPTIDKNNKILTANDDKYDLSKVILFQLIVQLPMFTLLSCDYGRTIPISLYTAFFLFHFSKVYGIKLDVTNIISKTSDRIMNMFSSHTIFSNIWVYLVTVLVFPFHTFVPSLLYDNVIIHSLEKIGKYIF